MRGIAIVVAVQVVAVEVVRRQFHLRDRPDVHVDGRTDFDFRERRLDLRGDRQRNDRRRAKANVLTRLLDALPDMREQLSRTVTASVAGGIEQNDARQPHRVQTVQIREKAFLRLLRRHAFARTDRNTAACVARQREKDLRNIFTVLSDQIHHVVAVHLAGQLVADGKLQTFAEDFVFQLVPKRRHGHSPPFAVANATIRWKTFSQ